MGRIPLDPGKLRRRAEEHVRSRQLEADASPPALQRLVHELEVHQVELELQNEELRETRVELESALARYTEIFDYAPIGYTTISFDGTLHEVNHAAARLLGGTRAEILRRRFDSFVLPGDRPIFLELLRRVVESELRESCQLQLLRVSGQVVEVHVLASLLARSEPLILLATDDRALGSASAQTVAQSGIHGTARAPDAAGRR
ncbi:MAG TPA: PAS domain-containing protein [Polyangiaceae bacterium]|nr:PAS domain-containing protein [Polyangiaceae bacterium]